MLRRRLDDTGRATCDILRELDPEAGLPLVHASRHGGTADTLAMLENLQGGHPVSPARFSMSVHNAILGVHSISQSHHRPLQALGACGDEFDALLYESFGYPAWRDILPLLPLSQKALCPLLIKGVLNIPVRHALLACD